MILNRVYWLAEFSSTMFPPLFPDNQFGFGKFRSSLDNLIILTTSIHTGFMRGQAMVAIFIDISSAFNNVLPHILIRDLMELGFPPLFINFINNPISFRVVQFVFQGYLSDPLTSRKGTPQGSILSLTLFNIYLRGINDVLDSHTSLLQFADDIVICSSSSCTLDALHSVENSFRNIDLYLSSRGLEISPRKTQMMISRKEGNPPAIYFIKTADYIIIPSASVRFLGVLLDPKLTGKNHMEHLIIKGGKTLQIITALRGTWWGAHPHLLLSIYKSMTRSSFEYAALIFALKDNVSSTKLQRIQNRAIRLCFGYRNSIPINVMHAESCTPLLKYRLQYLTAKYFLKIFSMEEHPVHQETSRIMRFGQFLLPYLGLYFPAALNFRRMWTHKYRLHSSTSLPAFVSHSFSATRHVPIVAFLYPQKA